MTLVDVILSRRSVRRYEPRPIPEETMKIILETARLAPSAINRQPWHFIVITEPKLKEQLSQGRYNKFLKDAAAVIAGCGEYSNSPLDRWVPIDVTIAMENMVIAAWSLGVGSCWIGDFDEKQVKELLGIPENVKVLALLSMGYPAERPPQREKKPLEKIVHYDKF